VADVEIVDTTLRDGNQSLWSARGVTTQLVRDAAPVIDRVGFGVCEFTTSTIMAMAVKHQGEDPFERIRIGKAAMPHTPLGFLTTGKRFITWNRTPDSLLALAYELLIRNGISRFWVCDPMVESAGAIENARLAKSLGAESVVCGLVFSISPIHTDAFYAEKARELDACAAIDGLYLKDPGGLLTPERLATLLPAVRGALRTTPVLEIHTHCNTGVAPRTLLDAADAGIGTVHCAVGVASNGSSHSPVGTTVSNLAERGHSTRIDRTALGEYEEILRAHVARHGLPVGAPVEYDETYYRHQLPGGMVSTTRRQLAEVGRESLLPAVMDEVVQVRRDFGYPIMVTPFSQFMVSQALLNVLSRQRYETLTDETVLYLLGDYGAPPGPVDQGLLDRASETGRRRRLTVDRAQPGLADLRATYGGDLSDEELLLSELISEEEVRRVRLGSRVAPAAAAPTTPSGLVALLEGLRDRPDIRSFSVSGPDLSFTMRR
jgi:oxaloacetate decarboxylase alpha subunit